MKLSKMTVVTAATLSAGAMVLGLAGTAGAEPLTDAGPSATVLISTPEATDGWAAGGGEAPASYGVTDPEGTWGDGVLTLAPDAAQGTSWYKTVDQPLTSVLTGKADGSVVPISFEYLTKGQAPTLNLRVLGASTAKKFADPENDGWASIVWTPPAGDGTWATATPGDTDQYWVTADIVDEDGAVVLKRGTRATLAQIVALNTDATLVEVGVQRTKDNSAERGGDLIGVDMFSFDGETTNFELKAPGGGETPGGGLFGSLDGLFGSLGDLIDFGSLS